jgi:hypothetical protein
LLRYNESGIYFYKGRINPVDWCCEVVVHAVAIGPVAGRNQVLPVRRGG